LKAHHEHEFEAAPGLPEKLPQGEHILWQGAPSAKSLALHVFHVRMLSVYFSFMLLVQGLYLAGEPGGLTWRPMLMSVGAAALALTLLGTVAWFAARNTLYTITNRRVVMRIGIVLTLTLNLPFKALSAAAVRNYQDGTGDIVVDLAGNDRIGWAHLWPHARPWALRKPQPSLRCLPDAQKVAAVLQTAWLAANPDIQAQVGQNAAAPRNARPLSQHTTAAAA
jgi:hypothetical protein